MQVFLRGLLIGLAYVAPIGAQNMFVINTAIAQPRKRAYLTALIVIFFDITLAVACYFGIGAIIEASPIVRQIVQLVGSLVIIWIGIGLIRAKAEMKTDETSTSLSYLKTAGRACVVTWFNPQAIIDGSMLLGAFRTELTAAESGFFIMGTSSASILWFLGITTIISLFSGVITDKLLRVINIICGIVMIFYGLKLLYTFILGLIA